MLYLDSNYTNPLSKGSQLTNTLTREEDYNYKKKKIIKELYSRSVNLLIIIINVCLNKENNNINDILNIKPIYYSLVINRYSNNLIRIKP